MKSKPSPHIERVFDVIVWTKKCASHDISRKLGLSTSTVARCVRDLQEAKRIIVIGTALDAGRKDIFRDSPIFAIPGTPLLTPRTKRVFRDKTRKPLNAAGSGKIAAGRYVAPFKRLRRDPEDVYPGAFNAR